jgi:hypothetical protein
MTTLTAAPTAPHLSKVALRFCIAKAKEAALPCKHARVLAGLEANALREKLLILQQPIPSDFLIQEFGNIDDSE